MAEGKFVISAQNKIKEGLDGAKKDLLGFEDAATKVGKTIQNALTVTAIAMGLKKLGEAAFDCFKEFAEGERRLTQLKLALDGNEASFTKATSLIDDMRKMSLASKDDIEGLVAELAALGKSDAEIEAITTAAVNLSNVTGKDLNSSFTLINATYAGTTGRLTQLLPEIGNLTKEELAAGDATKLINEKFTQLSTDLANGDISQKIKNISDEWGDFRENLGRAAAPVFNPIIEGINRIVSSWNNAMQAADGYRRIQGATTIGARLSAMQDIVSARMPRIDFLNDWLARYEQSVGGNKTMMMRDQGYVAKLAEYTDLTAEVEGLQVAIDELNEELATTLNTTLLLPGDIRPQVPSLLTAPTGQEGTNSNAITMPFYPVSADDFYLFQQALGESASDSIANVFGPAVEEALASNIIAKALAEQLSEAYAGVDMVGGNMGTTTSQRTSGTIDIDAYSSAYANAFAGAIDAELMPQFLEPIGELNTNLVNYQESLLLNFAPVKTMAEQLSDIYGSSGVDMVGGNMGTTTGGGNAGLSNEIRVPAFQAVLSDITAGMTGAFDVATVGLDSFGAALGPSMSTIIEALGPFANMLAGMNPLMALLIPVIVGFVSVIGPAITEVLAPLFNALTQVGQMLGAALLPILDALMPIFSLLANLIITNFTPILQLLAPVIQIIALVFQSMSPVLVLLTKAFTILMSPVQWLADLFGWLGGVMQTFAWNIAHPFRTRDYKGFSSDAFTGLQGRLDAIDAMGTNNQSLTASYSQSDATATQSANYRTQPITVNIYQQAPVVGSDGMQEFARMIRGEIEMLAYAGA